MVQQQEGSDMLGKHKDAILAAMIFTALGGWIGDPLWGALIGAASAGAFMILGDIAGLYIDRKKQDAG